ncbi:hypothetical protein TELCIR_10943, partial [Teladorsagia circumcincta]
MRPPAPVPSTLQLGVDGVVAMVTMVDKVEAWSRSRPTTKGAAFSSPNHHIHPQLPPLSSPSPKASTKRDEMESDGRTKAYKFVAYAAVSFSIVAVLSVVLTLPMVYNYVNHGSAKDIFAEVNFMKAHTGPSAPQNRTSRQSGYGAPE